MGLISKTNQDNNHNNNENTAGVLNWIKQLRCYKQHDLIPTTLKKQRDIGR